MPKVIRVRYEKGALKPLEPLDLREGEEVRIQVLPEEFPELVDKVSVEAGEDIDRILREVPGALEKVVLDSSTIVKSIESRAVGSQGTYTEEN